MKAVGKKAKPEFAPVTVTLTFDTQEELDAFTSVMDNSYICDTLRRLSGNRTMPETIRAPLIENGGSYLNYGDFDVRVED